MSPHTRFDPAFRLAGMAVLAFALLTGCATTYQPTGLTGGYREARISDSAYVVSFGGNGYATNDRVFYFWLYRCAELTEQKGFAFFSLRANRTPPTAALRPRAFTPVAYRAPMIVTVPGGGTSRAWRYSATVLMYHTPLPREVIWALNAQTVLNDLKPYVQTNGGAKPPARPALIRHAFMAHVWIDIGRGAKVGAGASGGYDPVTDTRAPRALADIVNGVDGSSIGFYQAFDEHALRNRDSSGGKIVLSFSITPNGQVKECHIISSTFSDRLFLAHVLTLVREIDFGPRDAPETTVSELPLTFTPRDL